MATRRTRGVVCFLSVVFLSVAQGSVYRAASSVPDTLVGTGPFGAITQLAKLSFPDGSGEVGDVTVSPDGNWAFVANRGAGDCSGAGGAGVWVVDITQRTAPTLVAFLPHAKGSRPTEGMHVIEASTKFFHGLLLVTNNERCGIGGKGGISIFDVTNPGRPKKISEHFGDGSPANNVRSVFAWDAGALAYAALADPDEPQDVDILDITNPNRPRLVAEYHLNALAAATGASFSQPNIGLTDSRIADMTLKAIDGRSIMLVSYRDGGFVLLDVTLPTQPLLLGDTSYAATDPQLLERTGIVLTPEGNARYAEFTTDNRFFIGIDEDTAPYRATGGEPEFDGWGYVHLYDATSLDELDTYGIPESHDEPYAVGFGNLSAHEVATDPQNSELAYVAYSAAGLRTLQIQCTDPSDSSTCELLEVGGYLGPTGNDFRGIEAVADPGGTVVVASDRRHRSLWLFRQQ